MTLTYQEYVLSKGKIINWADFTEQHPWATGNNPFNSMPVPSKCISAYYVVDLEKMRFVDRLCMVPWDLKYKSDFKQLSLAWVQEYFNEIEELDLKQLDTPEEVIIKPGGEVFFLLEGSGRVAGVVATVIDEGKCELVKMAVRTECKGKGYAHTLMTESIKWAKNKGHPFVELLSSVKLESAVGLYKKYGFETTHLGAHPNYKRCSMIMRLTF